MRQHLLRLIQEEEGASLIEYALVIAAGAVLAATLQPLFLNLADSAVDGAGSQIGSFLT